jgi:hypothetical protein
MNATTELTIAVPAALAAGPAGLAVQAMGAAAAVADIVLLGSTPRQRRAGTASGRPGLGERRRNRTGRENSAPAGVSLAAGEPERGQA